MEFLIAIIATAVITTAIVGSLVWLITLFLFKCYIETMSREQKPLLVFGKTYFFTTQDQIQKPCQSTIKSFSSGDLALCVKSRNDVEHRKTTVEFTVNKLAVFKPGVNYKIVDNYENKNQHQRA